MGRTTNRIEQRQGTPQRTVGVVLVQAVANGEQGVGAQIGFEHAVEHIDLARVAVEVGVLVLVGVDRSPADIALGGQRTGDVGLDAALVPGTGGQIDTRQRRGGRTLAHEVDGGGRVAAATHQTVGATQHLDTLERCEINGTILVAGRERNTHAVELEIGDVEAARGEVGTVGLDLLDSDAGGKFQHVVDAVELEVIDLGAGDGGDRLRGLPRSQLQLGRRAAGRGLVAVGLRAVGAADYGLRLELQGFAVGGQGMIETASGGGHGQAGLSAQHKDSPQCEYRMPCRVVLACRGRLPARAHRRPRHTDANANNYRLNFRSSLPSSSTQLNFIIVC